jgi:hypothetical protein
MGCLWWQHEKDNAIFRGPFSQTYCDKGLVTIQNEEDFISPDTCPDTHLRK